MSVKMTSKERKMQVVLRVRPLNHREMEQNQRNIIRVVDDNTIIFDPDEDEDEFFFHGTKQTHRDITKRVNKKLTMTFGRIFDNTASNMDVFEHAMRPLVSSVMQGYNCSAFVYGATGAGKTFTMLGNVDNPGISYLTMKELFRQIESLSDERKFDIGISYLEVYNEQVMNLLTRAGPLRLREDSNGVVISGLELRPIFDADGLLQLLALGNANRTQHPTDANAESSRSHAIFQVHIRMINKTTGEKRMVKLSMIDLAGSERGSSTKCVGQRFKEGASINKSLLALGNCINKLADGSKHIPYRDSNMTRILKDSLGGNCQTVMIANVSPSSLTYEDTYNTLKYASRAQKIRTSALTQNAYKSNLPKEFYVHKLTESTSEIEALKKKVRALEAQVKSSATATAINNNEDEHESFDAIAQGAKMWQEKIDKIYSELHQTQQSYFNLSSKEKVLLMRSKLKEYTETNRKLFNMNGDLLNRDINRVEASIGKFAKQIDAFQIDKIRWLKRFQDGKMELAQTRKQITDERILMILQPYMRFKKEELDKAQTSFRSDHYLKINRILNVELQNARKAVQLSGEIVQRNYLLLSANMLLTDEMKNKMSLLYKLHDNQRGVKFSATNDASGKGTVDDQDDDDVGAPCIFEDVSFETDIEEMSTRDIEIEENLFLAPKPIRAKRMLNVDEATMSMPKRFAPSTELNVTQVLETATETSNKIESTFCVKPKGTVKPTIKRTNSVRALRETSSNLNKVPFTVPKASIKPIINGRPMTPKQKENKRLLSAKKSPRRSPRRSPRANALGSRNKLNDVKRFLTTHKPSK